MNKNTAVVFDACVLYPAPLRDLLLELAGRAQENAWFRAKWTEEIHSEWIRNLLENREDLTLAQLDRTKTLMNGYIDDCLVADYEHHIAGLNLPDQNDRHVLAAAIESGASIIVTANISDFPAEAVLPNGIVAMTADDFVMEVIQTFEEGAENALEDAARAIKQRLKKPVMTWEQYFHCLSTMNGNELLKTVKLLRDVISSHEVDSENQDAIAEHLRDQ